MTTLSDNMSGWFKRRRAAAGDAQESANEGTTGGAAGEGSGNGVTASTTTGGGSSHEPVVVWEAANLMEAQVVKGRLESEGIPACIRSEAAGVIYGITAGSLARADVMVPGPLADKAVEILFADESADESAEDQAGVSSDGQAEDQTRGQAEE
jgi:hypothetical protein